MRVLFIHRLFTLTTLGREPLGILYLAAALKKGGHEVELADAESSGLALRKIESFRPHLLAYPIIRTGFHRFYLELNRKIQQNHPLPTVWGGPHPTFYPEMLQEERIDYICRGEGDEAFRELLDRLQDNLSPDEVANFWIKKESGKIIKNPPRPLVPDLDDLPFPDRELLYRYPAWERFPVKSFIAGRGCPYNCSYCFNPPLRELYGNPGNFVRRRSVENLLCEISEVKARYPLQFIQFEDDIFPSETKWLKKFSSLYPQRIGLPFAVNAHPETIRPQMIKLLKKAGCHSVNLGLETAETELRRRILKRKTSNERIIEACRLVKSSGIQLLLEVMLGIPGSGLEDDLATLRMAKQCRPDFSIASLFQPYPGTLFTRTKFFRENYSSITADRLGSFHDSSPFPLPRKREVENLRRLFSLSASGLLPPSILEKLIRYPLRIPYSLISILAKFIYAKRRAVPVTLTLSDYILNSRRILHR